MTFLVAPLVMRDRLLAILASRNARLDSLLAQHPAKPVRIVAAIADQARRRLGQLADEGFRPEIVTALPGAQVYVDRTAQRVAQRVQLGVQPAAGATDQPTGIVFFDPRATPLRCRLEAVR